MNGVSNDWLDSLRTPFKKSFLENISRQPLRRLQKYPPPKLSGAPVGHELRILRRFFNGRCSLLDPSGFSKLYRLPLAERDKNLYSAFIIGAPLPRNIWSMLIGSKHLDDWLENKLLQEKDGELASSFRVIAVGENLLVVDPVDIYFPNRVHIGQDSINMIEFLSKQKLQNVERYLDVGTGAGAILLELSRSCNEAIGIDVNPRAVELAQFNVELNANSVPSIYLEDVFRLGEDYGLFDLITWNVPFQFYPESDKETYFEGYGGEMGIEITLQFIEDVLPRLLSDNGECYLLSSAPIMHDNRNLMEEKLARLATGLCLEITVFMSQSYWIKDLQEFHDSHGIKRFESIILNIRRSGRGSIFRRNAFFASLPLDRVRRLLYNK